MVTVADIPRFVDDGYVEAVRVMGSTHRVLFYGDGTARFEHRCDRGEHAGVVICAPRIRVDVDGGHRIVSREPLTIEPSILCPDCKTHGFVRDERWVTA